MFNKIRFMCASLALMASVFLTPQSSSAQERLCDPSFENCYWNLLDLVNAENVGIDMAFYMIELPGLANAIISRHQAGVAVRIVIEPRANLKFPGNQALVDQFRAAGIPLRYKLGAGILHSKMMLLAGQNKVVFSGSNFGDADVAPYDPFVNYVDGAWYFTDDPAVVNSFKTRYDDNWTNTTLYGNYANIAGPLTRSYPTHPIDPAMNFVPNSNPAEDYGSRAMAKIDQETQRIDVTMYRITDTAITDAILRAVARGVQVRLLAEPLEYRFDVSRIGAQLSGAYNVDRLFMAGVQIKMRKHRGLNHQKSLQLFSQGMTIFGSSNWGVESYNFEEEHNYFTTKSWFFQWFGNQFDRKWNSATEYEPFVPKPPDAPTNLSPSNGASVELAPVTLTWEGGRWAHKYNIYFGTDPNNLSLIATDVSTGTPGPSGSESYTVSGLQPGLSYYWRIVGKTMANQAASGAVWRFITAGTPPPPQAPTVSAITPNSGTTNGGTSITISGSNFVSGATVSLGGVAATNVNVSNSATITATSPGHAAGGVNVVVTNPGGQSATLVNGYTYTAPPPQAPTVTAISPSSGTTAGGTSVTITGTNFAAGATVTIGGSAATSVNVVNSTSVTAITPAHSAGAVAVMVTNTNGQSGTLASGYTYTAPPPPPPPPPPPASEVVLYAAEATVRAGGWAVVSDASAAGGSRIHLPDAGVPKLTAPLASPAHYFEMTFNAEAGRPYRLWIRGKAQSDFWGNDSVWVQFSDSVTSSGAATYRIGTSSGTDINLEDCSGCGLLGWGWQDNGWGVGVMGPVIYFQTTGTHTIRVQNREDGLSIDQIVLSPQTYLNSAPGALKNDSTILPESGGGAPPPNQPPQVTITASPTSGTAPLAVNFSSSASDTDGQVASYNWSFGDGGSSSLASPSYTYQNGGTFTARLTVTDNQGATASASLSITVTNPPPPPPPPPVSEVVLYAAEAPVKAGGWVVVADASAAGGSRIHLPDASAPKLAAPRASPTHYFEMTFNAEAGRAYRLWIRGKAQNDYWGNDSVWVQFSGSVTSTGTATYRIGTTSGADINLEDCSGCGLQGWGWQDNGWGVGVMGPVIYFGSTGPQTIRVQTREDGLSIDQIVLSPGTFLNSSPGALKNDTVILPRSGTTSP